MVSNLTSPGKIEIEMWCKKVDSENYLGKQKGKEKWILKKEEMMIMMNKNITMMEMRNYVVWMSSCTGCKMSMASSQPHPRDREKTVWSKQEIFQNVPRGWGVLLNGDPYCGAFHF